MSAGSRRDLGKKKKKKKKALLFRSRMVRGCARVIVCPLFLPEQTGESCLVPVNKSSL